MKLRHWKRKRVVFATDTWFLRRLIWRLRPGPIESATYITGPELPGLRVLSCMGKPLRYDEQSGVFLRANGRSCSDALIEFLSHGNRLHVVSHSHPGIGSCATSPSGIDLHYLSDLQKKLRAQAIGLIVTRPTEKGLAFIRFYSVCVPFKVIISGKGFAAIKQTRHESVYAIEMLPESKNEGHAVTG